MNLHTKIETLENPTRLLDTPRNSISLQELETLKDMIAPGATLEELKLFLVFCNRSQLDPRLRQIYFTKFIDKRGKSKVNFITSIDGFRLIAQRTGEYEGQTAPQWCGTDGIWKDIWTESKSTPYAARVGVYRKGFKEALYAVAIYKEYAKENLWITMPALMIGKVAEALALRKAFPMELSGLYTQEEMEQANEKAISEKPKHIKKTYKELAGEVSLSTRFMKFKEKHLNNELNNTQYEEAVKIFKDSDFIEDVQQMYTDFKFVRDEKHES